MHFFYDAQRKLSAARRLQIVRCKGLLDGRPVWSPVPAPPARRRRDSDLRYCRTSAPPKWGGTASAQHRWGLEPPSSIVILLVQWSGHRW